MKKPNFVVFMTDHQRYDTVPPFDRCRMPHLERLSEHATVFTQAYCPSPHCCPSRATFFSGLYPSRHGIWNNYNCGNAFNRSLFPGVRLFPEDLRENGYETYFSGKWHVSATDIPAQRGFCHVSGGYGDMEPDPREKYEITAMQWEHYRNGRPTPGRDTRRNRDPAGRQAGQILWEGYAPKTLYGEQEDIFHSAAVADRAADYIREAAKRDRPFFVFASILEPHDPYFPEQRFLDLYPPQSIALPESYTDDMRDKPHLYARTQEVFRQLTEKEARECIRHYLAFCTQCDERFGRLMQALRESGTYDDTVVIYLSDHGDYCGEHGLFAKGLPCFEGAYRIPLVIGGGYFGKCGQRLVEDFVSLADLAPTILDLAGIRVDRTFSGYSLRPYCSGGRPDTVRDAIFTQSNGNELYGIQRSVTTADWKFVYNGFDFDELYDRKKDPEERHNLARDPAWQGLRRSLMKKIWQFAAENNDDCITDYILVSLAEYGPGIAFEGEGAE